MASRAFHIIVITLEVCVTNNWTKVSFDTFVSSQTYCEG